MRKENKNKRNGNQKRKKKRRKKEKKKIKKKKKKTESKTKLAILFFLHWSLCAGQQGDPYPLSQRDDQKYLSFIRMGKKLQGSSNMLKQSAFAHHSASMKQQQKRSATPVSKTLAL